MLTTVYPSFLCPSEEYSKEIFSTILTELTDDYQIQTRLTTNDPASSVPNDANLWCSQIQSGAYTADSNMVKKLNHNASERDRRKMLNHLYSSLRSLLPASDQFKKLSIPATISQVLKYIPELQQQVERLSERKEKLISNIHNQNQHKNKKLSTKQGTNQPLISATKLTETQIVIQISTLISNDVQKCLLSEILNLLEDEEGLSLISSSAFQSFLGRVFFTLHLQVEETHSSECEALCEKLVSLYEKSEVLFPLY
ncbi:basic helix-loop-helix (bHLH) DNA-binding superfamily protein [Euphorbia peplus]|nr:basic helix-loop-helix (bHLH) DNA-binding superfamily protein [Euphorbia peplus]